MVSYRVMLDVPRELVLFVSGLLVIFFNVLADFAYAIADPRISYA